MNRWDGEEKSVELDERKEMDGWMDGWVDDWMDGLMGK